MQSKIPVPVLKLELANSLIHGMGVLFSIIAMPALSVVAFRYAGSGGLLATAVYGFSFLMVFTFSTLYHGFQHPLVKEVLQILDHISIYFLIAGTYTPFILFYFYNSQGILMLKILWLLVILGIFFKVFFVNRFRLLSAFIYFMMGWLLIWTGKGFFAAMPWNVITLILAGNLLYSIGLIFYLWRRWTYHHAFWHTLVLAAAICHYAGVLIAAHANA